MGAAPNLGPSTNESVDFDAGFGKLLLDFVIAGPMIGPMRRGNHTADANLQSGASVQVSDSQRLNDDGCRAGATGHGLQALFPSTHAGHPLPALSRPCLPHPSSPSSDPSSGSRVVSWQVPRLPRRRETGRCRVQSLGDEMNRAMTRLAPRRRRVKSGYVRHLEGQVRYLSAKLREIASDIHAGAHPMAIADKADEAIEAFEFAAPKAGGQ